MTHTKSRNRLSGLKTNMKYDDEHQIGDYVDFILNFMPDGETPDNFITAGKVIKKHYDKEDMPPCSYDLEFTVQFDEGFVPMPGVETPKRITTRVHNVDEKYCWRRGTHENMDTAGVQIAAAIKTRESESFMQYSYNRKFVLYSTEYCVKASETEDAYKWDVKDMDAENKTVFTYTILKKSGETLTEKLITNINERLSYFDERFEEMVAMVKSDFDKGLLEKKAKDVN